MDTVFALFGIGVIILVPFAIVGTCFGVAAVILLEAVEDSYYGGRK
jgi:hypothetical protein